MGSGTAHVWVRSAGGDLVRSDIIIGLGCHDGRLEATGQDGSVTRLAGPGCPPGFDLAFLRVLEQQRTWHEDRWTVIIRAESTADGWQWLHVRLDDPGDAAGPPAVPPG